MKKLVVMIPAYNEERTIGKVINENPREIEGINQIEIVVINDGSTDNTVEEARKAVASLAAEVPHDRLNTVKDGLEDLTK